MFIFVLNQKVTLKQSGMKFKFFIALIVELLMCQCSSKFIKSSDNNLIFEGRTIKRTDSVSFCYPGTSVRMSFSGSSVYAKLKTNAGFYSVSIDNMQPYKISTFTYDLHNKDSLFCLAENLSSGKHTLQLTLITEGLVYRPVFYGFGISNGKVYPAIHKKHRIEFIGNSITCGYGVEAKSKDDDFADSTENYMLSYAGIIAQRFDAEAMVVARSGIGVYRNFGDEKTGSAHPLPSFYNQTFIYDSPSWNFTEFSPEYICLCLGTNDLSQGDYDLQQFKKAYFSFVEHLHKLYPKTKIILLSSPMLHKHRLADQISVLNALHKEYQDFTYRFDFSEQDGSLGYGANWHPSAARQMRMADELSGFIESIDPLWKLE